MIDRDDYLDPDEADAAEELERQIRINQMHQIAQWSAVLATETGRFVIWDILSQCGLHWHAPFGIEEHNRFEGRRELGIWLEKEVLTADPKAYTMMQREAEVRMKAGKSDD
jgi:hypothetical protein